MRVIVFIYGIMAYALFLLVALYAVGFVGNMFVPKSIDSGPEVPFNQALLIDIALIIFFGLQHSVMAREGFKKVWTKILPEPIERSTYVLLAGLILSLLFWQWRPLPTVLWNIENALGRLIVLGLFFGGWLFMFISTIMIGHFDLFGIRQVYLYLRGKPYTYEGFSTPGFYKYVRHPIMSGFIVAFWATPRMSVGHLVFSIVATIYILIGIFLEERDMANYFGKTFEEYRGQVTMLFPFPRIREQKEDKEDV